MVEILGITPGLFFVTTIILFGGAAWQTGQALAETWRPFTYLVPYALMLAVTNRLLLVLLFGGDFLAVMPFLVAAVILTGIATFAYRLTRVRKMVNQYPWIYERDGLLGWRERRDG
jgi:hypothetical protein